MNHVNTQYPLISSVLICVSVLTNLQLLLCLSNQEKPHQFCLFLMKGVKNSSIHIIYHNLQWANPWCTSHCKANMCPYLVKFWYWYSVSGWSVVYHIINLPNKTQVKIFSEYSRIASLFLDILLLFSLFSPSTALFQMTTTKTTAIKQQNTKRTDEINNNSNQTTCLEYGWEGRVLLTLT